MNKQSEACELGKKAWKAADKTINDANEKTFKEAKSIIELLKENISLWKEEEDEANQEAIV